MFNTRVFAKSLTVCPELSVTIPASTITKAGLSYTTNATSATAQSLMTVTGSVSSVPRVYVQKVDVSWSSNLTVWLKRTGNGTGLLAFNIEGGTNYQQITNNPVHFFDFFTLLGTIVSNIPIQYEISGLSVLIPAQSYTITLLYTLSY